MRSVVRDQGCERCCQGALLASYLESESRVESGSEEEKAVGVAEGCLCVRY